MPKTSQLQRRTRAANVVAGIQKRLPRDETYSLNGKAYSHEELAAFFQAQVDALDAIRSARAVLASAVAKERAVSRRVTARVPSFRDLIAQRFGMRPDALSDFGWTVPKKPGPKTVAGKLAGVEKARATRKARAPRD